MAKIPSDRCDRVQRDGTPMWINKKKDEDCDKAVNSYVNCRSRIYREDIDIPGTDLTQIMPATV